MQVIEDSLGYKNCTAYINVASLSTVESFSI